MPITKDTPGVEIELLCESEDIPVRGNCTTSDEPELDAKEEDEILARLDRGDEWAWFCAHVRVKFHGLTADDYLGGCSYANEKDFRDGDYFADMVSTCIDAINAEITKLNTVTAPSEEWKVIPGTAGTANMEEHRRFNGVLSLYVGPSGKRGPGGKYRPGFDHRWTIWSYGTLLGEGFTDSASSARSACQQEAERVEYRIRDVIKAMDVRGPTETL